MIIAAEAGVEAARALLDDVTEALVRLEGQWHESRLSTN
jgi:hypothetical protein